MPSDQMRIQTSFMTKMISKLISKFIKKKFGVEVDFRLHYLNISKDSDDDKKLEFAIKAAGTIDDDNLAVLIKNIKED